MDHTPIFVVATPQAFRDFQLATAPNPATGEPNPTRTADFLNYHPETRAFMEWAHCCGGLTLSLPLPSSILFQAWVRRDGVFRSMVSWR
jgi:hypothetical protein